VVVDRIDQEQERYVLGALISCREVDGYTKNPLSSLLNHIQDEKEKPSLHPLLKPREE